MKLKILFLLFLLFVSTNVSAQKRTLPRNISIKPVGIGAWRDLVLAEAGCKIAFPGVPNSPNRPKTPDYDKYFADVPPRNTGSYYLQTVNLYFNFTFYEISAGTEDAQEIERFYNSQSSSFALDDKLKLISETNVTVGTFVGRERLTGDRINTTVTKTRIFLINGYQYEFSVTGSPKVLDTQAETVNKYLNSFQLLETPPVTPTYPELKNYWTEFKSDEGNFKVLMPKPPKKTIMDVGSGEFKQTIFESNAYSYSVAVLFVDFPKSRVENKEPKELFDLFANYWETQAKFQKLDEKDVFFNGYYGRDYKYSNAEGLIIKVRVILVGRRIYQIMFLSPYSLVSPKSVVNFYEKLNNRFFSSFQFIKKIQPEGEVTMIFQNNGVKLQEWGIK